MPDRTFWRAVLRIAVPVIIQNFVTYFLNLIDVMMVGQLGEVSVAAVGLANQLPYILGLLLFGINTGSATLTAQLRGKSDVGNIRRVTALCLSLALTGGLIFTGLALFIPAQTMQIYSNDARVVASGAQFLRISGFSYLMMAVSLSYSTVLKSTGVVKAQMVISFFALGLKTFLNYLFIFGNWGAPQMGINGAALATVVSRLVEMSAIVFVVYRFHQHVAIYPRHFKGFQPGLLKVYFKTAVPVMFNELLWALGVSTYNIIYAHISVEAIAAYNIIYSIEAMAFVTFVGISDACGVLVGHKIGAGREEEAFRYARWLLGLAVMFAITIGFAIYLCRDLIVSWYQVEDITRSYVEGFLVILACMLWMRTSLMTLVVGIMRSGGDVRFSLVVDSGSIWLLGVPLAALGAFVLHVPVVMVYLMATSEEILKFVVCVYRFFSKKWIHNLAQRVETDQFMPENSGSGG